MNVGELNAKIDADDRGFNRAVDRSERKLVKLGATAVAVGGLVGKAFVGTALVTFALAAGQLVTTLSNLLAALTPILGIVTVLPAAVFALGSAFAALKIGLSGVGKAMEGDADALAKLSPNARTFVGEVRALGPAWDVVRRAVQDKLFSNLTGQIGPLANVWLPVLQQKLGGIAQALSTMGRNAMIAARDPGFVAHLGAGLDATHLALARIGDAVKPLVAGFGSLVAAGAPFIARFGAAVRDAGKAFGNWLTTAGKSGALTQFIQGALTALGQLATVLVEVVKVFMAIMTAANTSGASFLATMGDLLKSVYAFLTTGPGSDALVALFTGIHDIVQALLPSVGTLMAALGTAVTALAPALVPFAGALAAIVTALAPLLPIIGDVAAALAGVFGEALDEITPVLKILVPFLGTLAKALVAMLGPALKVLLKALTPIITALVVSFTPILPKLAAAFGSLAAAMMPIAATVGPAVAQVITILAGLIGWLLDHTTVLQGVAIAIGIALIPAFIGWAVSAGAAAVATIAATWPILAIIAAIALLVIGILYLVKNWDKVWAWIKGAAKAVGHWFSHDFVGFFVNAWHWITKTFADFRDWLAGWIIKALVAVRDFPEKVRGFFKDAIHWLVDAGKNIAVGLWNGIKSMGGWIIDHLKSWVQSVIPGPIAKVLGLASPSKVTRQLGRFTAAGIPLGIRDELPNVARASRQLARTATPNLSVAAPAVSVRAGDTHLYIDGRAVDDALIRSANRQPEKVALAVRAGEKKLDYAS